MVERLILAVVAWIKQGFSLFMDFLGKVSIWGWHQLVRLFGMHVNVTNNSLLALVVAIVVIILVGLIFWFFIARIRDAIESLVGVIAYVLSVLVTALVGFAAFMGSLGLLIFFITWVLGNVHVALR